MGSGYGSNISVFIDWFFVRLNIFQIYLGANRRRNFWSFKQRVLAKSIGMSSALSDLTGSEEFCRELEMKRTSHRATSSTGNLGESSNVQRTYSGYSTELRRVPAVHVGRESKQVHYLSYIIVIEQLELLKNYSFLHLIERYFKVPFSKSFHMWSLFCAGVVITFQQSDPIWSGHVPARMKAGRNGLW